MVRQGAAGNSLTSSASTTSQQFLDAEKWQKRFRHWVETTGTRIKNTREGTFKQIIPK